jgi:hypothetical protein
MGFLQDTEEREIVFKLQQKNILVHLSKDSVFYTSLEVDCRARCHLWWFPQIRGIYFGSTNAYNEKPDSLFQYLYDWIKVIEDFATNHDKEHVRFETKHNYTYELTAHKLYIFIYAISFTRDDKWHFCTPWVKLKKKTITEFKDHLLEYTKEHNINIRL